MTLKNHWHINIALSSKSFNLSMILFKQKKETYHNTWYIAVRAECASQNCGEYRAGKSDTHTLATNTATHSWKQTWNINY